MIHRSKNGLKPEKYIIFMTDGENTKASRNGFVSNPEADASTRATCTSARKASIRVYTIAFMAPPGGQKLLSDCATTKSDYFKAEDTASLVAAFKTIGERSAKNLVRLTN